MAADLMFSSFKFVTMRINIAAGTTGKGYPTRFLPQIIAEVFDFNM
jgi:hypothetical protein